MKRWRAQPDEDEPAVNVLLTHVASPLLKPSLNDVKKPDRNASRGSKAVHEVGLPYSDADSLLSSRNAETASSRSPGDSSSRASAGKVLLISSVLVVPTQTPV